MWRAAYRLLLWFAFPFVLARLWWRGRYEPAYRQNIAERFGFYPTSPARPVIWLHAVSVGETRAAEPLLHALRSRHPDCDLLITQMTATGREAAQQLFGGAALVAWLPYDYPSAVRRFLRSFRPRLGILMETEIWFHLVGECRRSGVPLLLANARMSAKSARGYAAVAPLLASRGLKFIRRSMNTALDADCDIVLGDSMGEMAAYYRACDLAFVGGSLLSYGGQNLIEACAAGVPVLIGPYTYNFAQAAESAVAAGAAMRVNSAEEVIRLARSILQDAGLRERMGKAGVARSEEHTSELQSPVH